MEEPRFHNRIGVFRRKTGYIYDVTNDKSVWTQHDKRITPEMHQVRGLLNFSHIIQKKSILPLSFHHHANIIELFCIVKGVRLVLLEQNGTVSRTAVYGNQVYISYPFEVHSNGSEPMPPSDYYVVQIDLSNPYDLFGLNRTRSYALYQALSNVPSRQLTVTATQIHTLSTAFQYFSELKPDYILCGIPFLECFLMTLQYMPPVGDNVKLMTMDPSIQRSIEYIHTHLSDELDLTVLASISSYSLSHFKARFKKEVGITPAEYINLQKFEYAKKTLIETDLNITDLAYSLGYSSTSYFCYMFRKYSTYTPREYRMLHKSSQDSKTGSQ